jgi:hypothetical protein
MNEPRTVSALVNIKIQALVTSRLPFLSMKHPIPIAAFVAERALDHEQS